MLDGWDDDYDELLINFKPMTRVDDDDTCEQQKRTNEEEEDQLRLFSSRDVIDHNVPQVINGGVERAPDEQQLMRTMSPCVSVGSERSFGFTYVESKENSDQGPPTTRSHSSDLHVPTDSEDDSEEGYPTTLHDIPIPEKSLRIHAIMALRRELVQLISEARGLANLIKPPISMDRWDTECMGHKNTQRLLRAMQYRSPEKQSIVRLTL
ncbi:unnamed protein product [Acanthoscelides obtectus]|uniref:Uncharacterized protein n=1 Tax=Acanthoscelides obtectus TaxID=200917 RepID=A0A9P0LX15_ACAOB|nr:unnamed protein product [Acanthoscelides obtectus]CAK1654765.1 hypothetical protein AOBTE_LOCUS18826 [Acanthoscelides obtectus]